MLLNRRVFVGLAVAAAATTFLGSPQRAGAAGGSRIKAIAFDAFTTFDPRPVFVLAEKLFPGRGAELSNVWRTRQFEYQWLRALSGHYADFWQATEAALVFAANLLKLDLTAEKQQTLMQAYLAVRAWPDAAPVLRSLKDSGVRMALLSNATAPLLDTWIKNSGLEGFYEHVLSTDQIRTYKPAPQAYQMGIDAFGLKREEIAFAAFGGWDVAGAKWFGYPTFWVNRLNVPMEELGVAPDAMGSTLTPLLDFVRA
jgi:2-haloacid dehalogenase